MFHLTAKVSIFTTKRKRRRKNKTQKKKNSYKRKITDVEEEVRVFVCSQYLLNVIYILYLYV